MSSFIAELRRRNVLRVAAAYALAAWIIIEAGSVLLPTFGASETTFQGYVIVVMESVLAYKRRVKEAFGRLNDIDGTDVRADGTARTLPKVLTVNVGFS